jgi:hypothetical protein
MITFRRDKVSEVPLGSVPEADGRRLEWLEGRKEETN